VGGTHYSVTTHSTSGMSSGGVDGGGGVLRTTYVGVGGLMGFLDSCVGHVVPGLELVAAYAQVSGWGGVGWGGAACTGPGGGGCEGIWGGPGWEERGGLQAINC
jgi:hypothetical protein